MVDFLIFFVPWIRNLEFEFDCQDCLPIFFFMIFNTFGMFGHEAVYAGASLLALLQQHDELL